MFDYAMTLAARGLEELKVKLLLKKITYVNHLILNRCFIQVIILLVAYVLTIMFRNLLNRIVLYNFFL